MTNDKLDILTIILIALADIFFKISQYSNLLYFCLSDGASSDE